MTEDEVKKALARVKAATAGEWLHHEGDRGFYWVQSVTAEYPYICESRPRSPNAKNDFAFIAHARTDVEALADDSLRLREDAERWQLIRDNLPDSNAILERARRSDGLRWLFEEGKRKEKEEAAAAGEGGG